MPPGKFIGYVLKFGGGLAGDLARHRELRRVRSSRLKIQVQGSRDQESAIY